MRKKILILVVFFFTVNGFSQQLQKDRWVVMDFAWFKPSTINQQADTLFDRYLPLWQKAAGDKGIIFSFNWVVDLVTEYKGELKQKLPFRSPNSEWWNDKSYADLKAFINVLRDKATAKGLHNFHIGMECIAFPRLISVYGKYNYPSDWADRHPELYKRFGLIDPLCKLERDKYSYASRPKGIKKGEYFSTFFGDQWGIVSKELNLDVMLLWDSWATLRCYNRIGVFGKRADKDPSKNKELSDAIVRTFRDIKKGNTDALLIGYSSGASAIGELRVNTFDLEGLVADGFIDAWIDQTWGGAWNDYWGMERDGWTFQLAYQLQHALMIEKGNIKRTKPCKHYNIVAPLDAYEPWDIIHSTPNKLRWSIWAYNNASIITQNGYKQVDGSVVAWCNNPFMQLLSRQDVALLSESLNAADESASKIEEVYGATFVYNRPVIDWLNANDPSSLNSEWIDEQAAMLMKWGVPCLSAVSSQTLNRASAAKKILLYQLPGQVSKEMQENIAQNAEKGFPQMFIGRAGRIDNPLLTLAGVKTNDSLYLTGDYECIMSGNSEPGLPKETNVHLSEFNPVHVEAANVLVRTPQTALLTQANNNLIFYWQPPDWRHPEKADLDQQQYGSVVPYYLASRELLKASKKTGLTHVRPNAVMLPVAFHFWKTGKRIYFLFGNIETNSMGDARTKREVFLYLNKSELKLEDRNYELKEYFASRNMSAFGSESDFLIYYLKIEPEGIGLYYIDL